MKNIVLMFCLFCLSACSNNDSSVTRVNNGNYAVSGTVTAGGNPIAGAVITFTGTSSGTATTDADGKYSFTGVNNGIYQVSAAKTGYIVTPSIIQVTVDSSDASDRNFAAVPANHNITGSVKVSVSGAALSGATVTLAGTSLIGATSVTVKTDSAGNYTLPVIAGSYSITAEQTGYDISGKLDLVVSDVDVAGQNFIATPASYTISGTVTMGAAPLSGVTVTRSGSAVVAVTKADGSYSFSVTNGSYSITPTLAGYYFSPVSLTAVVSNASAPGQDFLAALTLQLSSLTPSSATVLFGNNLNVVASLSVPATSDTDVALSSNNDGIVVPAKVTVPAGSSSAQFSVTANASGDVVLTATLNGKNAVTQIHVRTAVCGNGIIEPGEQCDDGNKVSGDACSSTCTLEQGYACSGLPTLCHKTVCGDGKLEGFEECDDGNLIAGDGCSATCKIEAAVGTCGDGIRRVNEACNDGNKANGDGCSSTCAVEVGWSCSGAVGSSSVCTSVCGDGIVTGSEQCDTGSNNGLPGSGCRFNCTVEPGWACYNLVGSGSICTPTVL